VVVIIGGSKSKSGIKPVKKRKKQCHVSYVDFDMRILAICKEAACSRTKICEGLRLNLVLYGLVGSRVDFLVELGLLVGVRVGRKRLNGTFKGNASLVYYACTDRGEQALFYFTLFKEFYKGKGGLGASGEEGSDGTDGSVVSRFVVDGCHVEFVKPPEQSGNCKGEVPL
jgi:hypothetical protein